MDPERLKWITNPPTLDRWEVGVRYARTPAGLQATYTAMGYCDRKRGALWVYGDTVPTGDGRYDLHDHLWSLSTACGTVGPVTAPALERALAGEYWEQQSLFDPPT